LILAEWHDPDDLLGALPGTTAILSDAGLLETKADGPLPAG